MSAEAQKEPMTKYLMYKLAVRSCDRDLATECLESVSSSTDGQELLYACVIEAHHSGDQVCAVGALKKLIEKYEFKSPSPIHLPALLRCTIRLLCKFLDGEDGEDGQGAITRDICDIFDAGTVFP